MLDVISRRQLLACAATTILGSLFPAIATTPVFAQVDGSLPRPEGRPILRIGGQISVVNDGEEAVFDVAMLDALGTTSFSTSTPWTEGVATWEGVSLAKLMEVVGATGTSIRATALNDYVTEVPLAGLSTEGAILAMRRNGALMPVSDKGPLFIMYPFDDRKDLQHQSIFMRCAWQVARLDVL